MEVAMPSTVGSAGIPKADPMERRLVIGHPDPADDVAVMPRSPMLPRMAENDAPAFFRSIKPSAPGANGAPGFTIWLN